MTANQIAYQQMLADVRKKDAETESIRMANEMQELENRYSKYYDYDIGDLSNVPSKAQMNEYIFGRGAKMGSELVQLLSPVKLNFSFK